MKTFGRAVRLLVPLAFGLFLWKGRQLGSVAFAPMEMGAAPLWVVLIVASLIRWPRLWVLMPGLFVTRIAIVQGAASWVDWATYPQVAIPILASTLLLIGVTSAYRRIPSPVPNAPGTIVPNADGIGALLALPVVGLQVYAAAVGWFPAIDWRTALLVEMLAFAGLRAVLYARKGQLPTRGRGWVACLLGITVALAYTLYWARPDLSSGWTYGRNAAIMAGITVWAIQRAVIPWRNPSTVP